MPLTLRIVFFSPEAIDKGYRYGSYYCYEEDCDRCIPLRELYDKGILQPTNEYFTRCYVRNDKSDGKGEFVPFSTLTEEEKQEFFKNWSKDLNESLAHWNKEYWQAHEQTEQSVKPVGENTDLNAVGFDQSELGGAKARFKSNIEAIRLLKRLNFEKREPTHAEQKHLLNTSVGAAWQKRLTNTTKNGEANTPSLYQRSIPKITRKQRVAF